MNFNRTLPDVIADILTYNGSLVEKTDEGSLEVIVPQKVSEILSLQEHTRLYFSYDDARHNAVYASYDSELFKSVAKLFAGRGKFSIARLETSIPNTEKLTKVISGKISFSNATFRLEKTESKDISYLLLYFKYIALSDEKREGILPILINQMNLSTMPLENGINGIIERLKESDSELESHKPESIKVFQAAYSAAAHMIQERLKDFVKSLERRLSRDIKRVYEYYGTLRDETLGLIEQNVFQVSMSALISSERKKALKYKDHFLKEQTLKAAEKMEQQYLENKARIEKMIKEKKWELRRDEKIDKLLTKLDIIETEQKWKIQDVIAKYALNAQIEPVAVIRIETLASVFWINIKRRLASRLFPITYNPIVRQFDALPCESCFNPYGGYYICDDNLHIVCSNCFKTCSFCGKQYCKACYKDKCPKCQKVN